MLEEEMLLETMEDILQLLIILDMEEEVEEQTE